MIFRIFISLLVVTILQTPAIFAQHAAVKKGLDIRKHGMQSDTANLAFLVKTARVQVNTVPSSHLVKDSIEREMRIASKINDQIKSNKYNGLIALVQANFYNLRDDYDSTLYYVKSAIFYLQKINAYQDLGEAYQLYSMNTSYDNYSLKIGAMQKSKFYYQKAGNESAIAATKIYISSYLSIYKQYKLENSKAKILRSEIIPDRENKLQILLLLKIAEYQIKKPLEETADLDSARYYVSRAAQINDKLKDGECEALITICWADLYEERDYGSLWSKLYKERTNSANEIAVIQKGIKTLSPTNTNNVFIGDLYSRLSKAYQTHYRTFNLMINAALTSIHYYRLAGQNKKMGDVFFKLGELNRDKNINLAQHQLEEALRLYKSINYRDLAKLYLELSDIANLKGDLDQTISLNLECQKYITSSTPFDVQIRSASDLMYIYYNADMLPQTIFWSEKLSQVSKTAGDLDKYYAAIQISTIVLDQTHHPFEALKRLKEAVNKYPPQNIDQERNLDEAFAECLANLHQYTKAEQYMTKYETSLENYSFEYVPQDENYPIDLTNCLFYVARFYATIGKPEKANAYLLKMHIAAAKTKKIWPQRSNAMEVLEFKIDTALKDYKSALLHYEHSNRVKDSLLSASKTKAIEELNVRYATEAKVKDIKLLKNRNEIQIGQLKQITLQKNLVIAGIILIFLISLFIFYNYRQKQRTNWELESKQKMINEQNAALEGLVSQKDDLLQDKERLLVDKELLIMEIQHRVKNNLHMISSLLESQSAYLEDEALLAIQKGQHRIQAISLVHQKLYANTDVMEVAMDVYLRELITYLRESVVTDQNIVFDVDLDPISLSGGQAMPLGLIVNEAVTNAIKYAFGDRHLGHIGISLKQETDNYISLSIFDDGVGLPPDHEENTKASSMGMKLIKGLAKTIGGEVTIQSAPGTTIDLRFEKIELFNFDPDQKEYPSVNTGVS